MSGTPVPPDSTPRAAGLTAGAVPGGAEVRSFTSPLLELPGAVPARGLDEGVALHYGDPTGEQRAMDEHAGFVDRSNRTATVATGVDRLPWLQSITSQQIVDLPGGCAAEALVLSPDGQVEHHMYVSNVADTTWINTEPKAGPELLGFLASMRFVLRVQINDVSAEWGVMSMVGPDSVDVLGKIGLIAPYDDYEVASLSGGGWLRRMPYPGRDAVDLMVPRILLPQVAQRLSEAGARPAGVEAFDALRIEAGRPRLRVDTDPQTLPQEVGWMDIAVARDKQGYRGQEAVARAEQSDGWPRRTVLLRFDGSVEELPPHGTPVEADGRAVGHVGSTARHHALGPVGLAVVARAVGDGDVVSVRGERVSVEPQPAGERAVRASRSQCVRSQASRAPRSGPRAGR